MKCHSCNETEMKEYTSSGERTYFLCPKCNPNETIHDEPRAGLDGKCCVCSEIVFLGIDKDYICARCDGFIHFECCMHIFEDDDSVSGCSEDDLDYDSHLYCANCVSPPTAENGESCK